jgi:uncharacterized RDD family membrane protein YckC
MTPPHTLGDMTNPPQPPEEPFPYGTPAASSSPYGPPAPAYDPSAYGAPAGAPSVPLGGRWRRLFAAIVDSIIVGVVSGAITAPFANWNEITKSHYSVGEGFANLAGALITFAYYWYQHGKWGQTIGKRLFALRVVDVAGGPIGWGQSAWRLIFEYLLTIITCGIGGLIDVAWILWDPRKQALHDKVAKTLVVTADPSVPNPYEGR